MKLAKEITALQLWRLVNKTLPWLILATGLATTYWMQQTAIDTANQRLQRDFAFQNSETELLIKQRLTAYKQILRSTRALFASSDSVTRSEFHRFVENLHLTNIYPGIQSLGFAVLLSPQEKTRHIQAIRREGFPKYDIKPAGERDQYAPVMYLEPFDALNQRAFGFDIDSEPVRQAAMLHARDLDQVAVSGKLRLVQETQVHGQAGFVMVLPIYRNEAPIANLAERQANIAGWVFAAFRMDDLMQAILGDHTNEIGIDIYDDEHNTPEALLFSSNSHLPAKARSALYQAQQTIDIYGHPWTIHWHSLPGFEAKLNLAQVIHIRLSGVLLSILLSLLIWQLTHLRQRAYQLAQEMTVDLQASKNRTKATLVELQQLKFAFDQHAIVVKTDVRGTITYVNEKFCQISGYSRVELLGQNHRLLNSGAHPPEFFREMFRNITGGTVWHGEICNRAKGGHLYWVLTTIVPILNDQGKPTEYIAIRSDISQLKLIEQRLADANRTLQSVLDAASEIAIVATDSKGFISIFNRGAEKMFGYSAEEMVGKQRPQILHVAAEIEQRAAELSTELGTRVRSFEVFTKKAELLGQESRQWTNVRKDGLLLKTSLLVTPIRNTQGQVDGYLGIIRDITTEYLAQLALKKSEAKLRSLFELSPLGIVLTDLKGKYLEFNDAFCRICGYSVDELKSLDYWSLTPEKYYDQEQQLLQLMMQTGRYGPYEKEYRRKDGSLIPLRLNGVLIKDIDNKDYIWSIIEDITTTKQIEDTLRQAKVAADDASRIKSEFVATVSHELRTPLTSIQGAIELALGGATGVLPEPTSHLLTIASNNCKRLVRMVNEMLNLERLESGGMVFDTKPIDIIPLVTQAIESNQAYAEKFGITLGVLNEQAEILVVADSDHFIQVLTNILSNAIKFSHPGGRVEVALSSTEQRLRVSVTDYGIGIQDSFKDRIFEKFTQEDASNTRQKGGSGLGLSISKAIIEKMNGSIDYLSEPGIKTTFFFELPLYRP